MLTNTRTILVEWGDCDPAGIVYFPRYFEWFDGCTTALFARAGLRKHEMLDKFEIVGIPLVEARARFVAPSKFGDEVTVETEITKFGRSSFDVHHRLMRSGELAAEGFETRVWTGRRPDDPERLRALPIPEEVIARFKCP